MSNIKKVPKEDIYGLTDAQKLAWYDLFGIKGGTGLEHAGSLVSDAVVALLGNLMQANFFESHLCTYDLSRQGVNKFDCINPRHNYSDTDWRKAAILFLSRPQEAGGEINA